ncbi:hypothetical protein A1Q2_01005 [Trichosporon asahii var. asahii CBS 8904]|uniref:Uncharacterized protein n=1 Tax=Trichosporon asahii var. asahii (strain CBS 8904) TaxID=1220162 RepID=K1VKT5_TRIAC|nr:hypothetical protein A1Q2_01005 [Trichosporon asahii var. asahii CBS 8904]
MRLLSTLPPLGTSPFASFSFASLSPPTAPRAAHSFKTTDCHHSTTTRDFHCFVTPPPAPPERTTTSQSQGRRYSMASPFPSRPTSIDGVHFVQRRDLNPLRHRPHKFAIYFFNALRATALFRIWHMLVFLGGWAAMVVLVSEKTKADLGIPTTMITVRVLLGLTLSYRTSSAYERYQEGRRMWALIILASRNWARTVWFHCPDSMSGNPPSDPQAKAQDEARAVIEKKTIVQLALAFAVSVKHYLRGEEGIYYEDLFHLVNFIPSLDLPSGMAMGNATIQPDLPSLSSNHPGYHTRPMSTLSKEPTYVSPETPGYLRPADDAPGFDWSSLFRFHKKNKVADEEKARQAQRVETAPMPFGCNNIPLEITMFMSSWVATMEKRKVIGVPTINQLNLCLNQLNEALATLERILTTPIPCTVIVGYIIIGYASIAEEIEQPFGYDRNDLNLGYFCRHIIARELDAITARPLVDPDEYVFTSKNRPLGDCEPSADRLVEKSVEVIRSRLAVTGLVGSATTAKASLAYPETQGNLANGPQRNDTRTSLSYAQKTSPLACVPPMCSSSSSD